MLQIRKIPNAIIKQLDNFVDHEIYSINLNPILSTNRYICQVYFILITIQITHTL